MFVLLTLLAITAVVSVAGTVVMTMRDGYGSKVAARPQTPIHESMRMF